MNRLKTRVTAIISFFTLASSVNAQNAQPINVLTTAVPFLRISPDARAGGMGDVGVATSPDAASSFYNLAKTPFAKKDIGIGFTYTPWLKDLGLNDVYLLAASGYYKLSPNEAISGSIRYFSLGTIQFTDYSGNEVGNGRPRELGADIGYARKLGDKLALSLAARYIYSNLASGAASSSSTYKAGTSVAADVSVYYHGATEDRGGWNFGLALTNLGEKIGYTNSATEKDYIPADLGLGAAYTKVFDEDNRVTFGLDFHKLLVPSAPLSVDNGGPIDSAALADYKSKPVVSSWFSSFGGSGGFTGQLKLVQASLGAEYAYQDQFFLRAGYFYESQTNGGRKYFSVGVGLKYNVMGLNFSYLVPSGSGTTRSPLSNTLRFGLTFDLDKDENSSSTPVTPTN